MENKKINVLFGVTVIAFLVVTFILVGDFNAARNTDFQEYRATLSQIIKLKNNKIKALSRENAQLRGMLAQAKSSLDALSRKLVPPAPAVEAQPAKAPATPAAAPAK